MAQRLGYDGDILMGAGAFVFDERSCVLLIKENYGARRFSLPGGAVEKDESPQEAVVREAMEEVGVRVIVDYLVGVVAFPPEYDLPYFLGFAFRCTIAEGTPFRASPDEIADVGWFDSDAPPSPLSNVARLLLGAAASGQRGVVLGPMPRPVPPLGG